MTPFTEIAALQQCEERYPCAPHRSGGIQLDTRFVTAQAQPLVGNRGLRPA